MTKVLKSTLTYTIITALLVFLLSGCAAMKKDSDSPDAATNTPPANEPYFPTSFGDFEVPGELRLERKDTLFINTSSFVGGIVKLTGHVEVGSLTDFFVNSMQKNGWKITGEIRYENVLLSFTKPNKNCMITIYDGTYGTRTEVYAYITEDVQGSNL